MLCCLLHALHRLPPEALQPDTDGRTVLSRWVLQHMEGIAARADARTLTDTMLASEIEIIDGYRIGPGRCVIDEAGLIVPVSKCTMKELRAEAKARDLQDAEDMKRPELVQAIKVCPLWASCWAACMAGPWWLPARAEPQALVSLLLRTVTGPTV